MQRRTDVSIQPPDADGNEANGHQVDLSSVSEVTITVTSADGSRMKVYRVRFGEGVELQQGWNAIEWTGTDSVPIADALRDAGLAERTLVVYRWDEVSQTWLAYFPGLEDVPGLNTLTTLQQGGTYWVAVTEPLTWTIETQG